MQDFQLDIVTPYGEIFNGRVSSVYLPGKEGEFGVLPGHCDMLALLQTGVIDIRSESGHDLVAINWGHASISNNKVSVLADGAVCVRGGDSKLSKALEQAKKLLQEASSDTSMIAGALRKLEETK
ncbi:ATP synthase F1 subunit epsilon [Helicobacter trogontum]|uniref:ATP synthase epsilon chain n=1 Tax=Helicobacter trogontum TaxID=50960 RepID=A0A4U8T9R5_9HELI|nr:ATP synthase F1 subunit epsilon [Helicobacter trogontum]MDY5185091.1 ATP synthase F1 subunit epsilon [Helicobacter trogontum]TLD96403.1 F0F1 ATP synthase subunit epsilon [Helicobacter trogontum]